MMVPEMWLCHIHPHPSLCLQLSEAYGQKEWVLHSRAADFTWGTVQHLGPISWDPIHPVLEHRACPLFCLTIQQPGPWWSFLFPSMFPGAWLQKQLSPAKSQLEKPLPHKQGSKASHCSIKAMGASLPGCHFLCPVCQSRAGHSYSLMDRRLHP